MGDLNGDGLGDVVESNFLNPRYIQQGTGVAQFYYMMKPNPERSGLDIAPTTLFKSDSSGRSLDVGQIFDDSKLPDIVHAMANGEIRVFANQGKDNNRFLGFEERQRLQVDSSCSIRDILITSLSPNTVSLVCAVTCGSQSSDGSNYVFTARKAGKITRKRGSMKNMSMKKHKMNMKGKGKMNGKRIENPKMGKGKKGKR